MDAQDPSQLRISDDDRHKVAEVLREAAGEGRIDFEELDQRLEATYAARTYADLVPITLDLPMQTAAQLPVHPVAAASPSPVVPGAAREKHLAILSGVERKGVWVVPQHLTVNCFMGGADLDLRRGQVAAREGVVTLNAPVGGGGNKGKPHTPAIVGGTGGVGGVRGPARQKGAPP